MEGKAPIFLGGYSFVVFQETTRVFDYQSLGVGITVFGQKLPPVPVQGLTNGNPFVRG
jgi:hypothetical protein